MSISCIVIDMDFKSYLGTSASQIQERAVLLLKKWEEETVNQFLAKRIARVAKEENRTQSELLREAFRRYEFERDWVKIKAWGKETAKRFNIKSDEDVERIAG